MTEDRRQKTEDRSQMNQPLIKSFCRGVQGGQFFQKAPPLCFTEPKAKEV
jgi:hypothetical protein